MAREEEGLAAVERAAAEAAEAEGVEEMAVGAEVGVETVEEMERVVVSALVEGEASRAPGGRRPHRSSHLFHFGSQAS